MGVVGSLAASTRAWGGGGLDWTEAIWPKLWVEEFASVVAAPPPLFFILFRTMGGDVGGPYGGSQHA